MNYLKLEDIGRLSMWKITIVIALVIVVYLVIKYLIYSPAIKKKVKE